MSHAPSPDPSAAGALTGTSGVGPTLPAERHLEVLRAEIARTSRLTRSVAHDAPLHHLPGWCVGDCIAHLVGDFEWAASIVERRAWNPSGIVSNSADGDELADAFDAAARRLVRALEGSLDDLDAPCPNFADGTEGRVAFWFRRQAHETTMHRWDLEVPTGRHDQIAAEVAADGVDEALHVYTRRYGGQQLDLPLVLRCDDADVSWLVRPITVDGDATRVAVDRIAGGASGPGDVIGPAEGLLLAIQHRLDPDAAGLRFPHHEIAARSFLAGPLVA